MNEFVFADDFKSDYIQCSLIGQGGFGNVYAGLRAADSVPVSNNNVSSHPKRALLTLMLIIFNCRWP